MAHPGADHLGRGWSGFGNWRRSRPFWGGLLVIVGAGEILLSEKAPLPLVIHIGLQGLAGYLVPAILLLCGLLLWFHPVQRTFYSVLAVLLSLGSWVTSNLGGFFVGMLLGLIGGALAFAWAQVDDAGAGRSWRPPRWWPGWRDREPSVGLDVLFGRDRAGDGTGLTARSPQRPPAGGIDDDDTSQAVGLAGQEGRRARGRRAQLRLGRAVSPLVTLPVAPLVLALIAATAQQARSAAGLPSASSGMVLLASPKPTATATPSHWPLHWRKVWPSPRAAPSLRHAAASGAPAATGSFSLSAGSATMTGLSFDGVARVSTARGTVPMLKFSMAAMTLAGCVLTFRRLGQAFVIKDDSLGFSGYIVLYATEVSGELRGTAVRFTPKRPPASLDRDMTLTDLVATQPYAIAGALEASGLQLLAAPASALTS